MRLGADVEQLDRLAALLERSSWSMESLRAELSAAARVPDWLGPDADRFRQQWSAGGGSDIASVAAQLASATTAVRQQAAAQRLTSATNDMDGEGAVVAPFAGTLPPGPDRIRVVTVDVVGGGEFVGGASGEFVIEDLTDHRVRVTEAVRINGGLGASGGQGVVIDMGKSSTAEGLLAGAAAQVVAGSGTSWVVDETDLDSVLVALARDHLAGPTAGIVSELDGVPGLGLAAGLLGLGPVLGGLTYDLPAPESRSVMAGANVDASMTGAATSAKAFAGGSIGGVGTVGATRRASGDTVVWVESGLAADGAMRTIFGTREGSAGAETRIGVRLDSSGDVVGLELAQATTLDDRMVKRSADVDLTAPEIRVAAARLGESIRAGDDIGAHLSALLVAGAAHTRVATDVYVAGESRAYGIEVPFGAVSINSVEMDRQS